MSLTYLGPADTLTLADGTELHKGDAATVDDATKAALEAAGHQFLDSESGGAPVEMAPQSAAENLAAQGTTAEAQAAEAGLSVDAPAPKN